MNSDFRRAAEYSHSTARLNNELRDHKRKLNLKREQCPEYARDIRRLMDEIDKELERYAKIRERYHGYCRKGFINFLNRWCNYTYTY